jgi:hypothetical protein
MKTMLKAKEAIYMRKAKVTNTDALGNKQNNKNDTMCIDQPTIITIFFVASFKELNHFFIAFTLSAF